MNATLYCAPKAIHASSGFLAASVKAFSIPITLVLETCSMAWLDINLYLGLRLIIDKTFPLIETLPRQECSAGSNMSVIGPIVWVRFPQAPSRHLEFAASGFNILPRNCWSQCGAATLGSKTDFFVVERGVSFRIQPDVSWGWRGGLVDWHVSNLWNTFLIGTSSNSVADNSTTLLGALVRKEFQADVAAITQGFSPSIVPVRTEWTLAEQGE